MLTDLLLLLGVGVWHRAMEWLGITEGVHDWLEGFCPCAT